VCARREASGGLISGLGRARGRRRARRLTNGRTVDDTQVVRRALVRTAAIGVSAEQEAENQTRVKVLSEALPYLQRFSGQTVVVKYGGAAMKNETLKAAVIRDLVLLSTVGIRPVLVHGGGPEINAMLEKVGIEPKFLNGLRVTDAATMEVVEQILTGKVNKSLVSLISVAGGRAVGICGKDGNLLRGKVKKEELGFVGDVTQVDTSLIRELVNAGYIPVVATVAMDAQGQALNVNADTAAGAIAAKLGAEKLILMTDVPGVCTDKDDPNTLIRELTMEETHKAIAGGVIAGGMIPKVECCMNSITNGVKSAHIIDGRAKHSLLLEILTDEGVGTVITEDVIAV
jgi:acetylglutamate kinase